jgi:hypothetical protein
MMNQSLTKAQRREVRRLAGVAHERELATAVEALQVDFNRWRSGEMDVFALNECIHKFHNGISRDLFKFYGMGGGEDMSVGNAIARGILQETEVDPQILKVLGGFIELVRENLIEAEKAS